MTPRSIRKLAKAVRSLRHPLSRAALYRFVAPSFEHRSLLTGLGKLNCLVDVGANVGQFSMLFRITNPSSRIHAFEPLKEAAKTYSSIMIKEDNVKLHRCALGATSAQVKINVTARSDSSSIFYPTMQKVLFPGTEAVREEVIEVHALKTILSADDIPSPALLKIDVQGYELEVLKGSEALLTSFDWILCEASFLHLYRGQPLADEIIVWLFDRGFRLASVNCNDPAVEQGRSIQADLLFKRSNL